MDSRGRAFDNIFCERLWRSVKYIPALHKKCSFFFRSSAWPCTSVEPDLARHSKRPFSPAAIKKGSLFKSRRNAHTLAIGPQVPHPNYGIRDFLVPTGIISSSKNSSFVETILLDYCFKARTSFFPYCNRNEWPVSCRNRLFHLEISGRYDQRGYLLISPQAAAHCKEGTIASGLILDLARNDEDPLAWHFGKTDS